MHDEQTGFVLSGPRPGDLGWIVQRHGALYAESTAGTRASRRLVARHRRRLRQDHDPRREAAWIAELDGEPAGCVLCVRRRRDGPAAPAARRPPAPAGAASARGSSRSASASPSTPATGAHAVDQRRPARGAAHLRARRLRARARGAAPQLRPRPRRADLVAYPPTMERDELRALQAPLKERYRDEPEAAHDHAPRRAAARRGRVLLGRRPAGRWPRPACTPRPAATARCCARATCCSRRSSACAGVTLQAVATSLGSTSTAAASTPRATSTSAARSASTRTRRSASSGIRLQLRARHRRRRRAARDAAEADRALLRRLPDARPRPAARRHAGPREGDGLGHRGPAHGGPSGMTGWEERFSRVS